MVAENKTEKEENKIQRTNIEWCRNPDGSPGYSWNVITGCLNDCPYCYARKLANGRLRERYLANPHTAIQPRSMDDPLWDRITTDPFYPRFWRERLENIKRPEYPFNAWSGNAPNTGWHWLLSPPNFHAKRKKVGVFCCDMGDLFGIGIPKEWTRQVLDAITVNGIDRFYLLTKQPQNLIHWSPFPPNCWVGVSATNTRMALDAVRHLRIIDATVKFLSLEPMLNSINLPVQFLMDCDITWLIVGAQTKPTIYPKIEWVQEIESVAQQAGIPVFEKDNLKPLLNRELRQEMPHG